MGRNMGSMIRSERSTCIAIQAWDDGRGNPKIETDSQESRRRSRRNANWSRAAWRSCTLKSERHERPEPETPRCIARCVVYCARCLTKYVHRKRELYIEHYLVCVLFSVSIQYRPAKNYNILYSLYHRFLNIFFLSGNLGILKFLFISKNIRKGLWSSI